jgi:hypothetical protein
LILVDTTRWRNFLAISSYYSRENEEARKELKGITKRIYYTKRKARGERDYYR